jgi:hypothetical protein
VKGGLRTVHLKIDTYIIVMRHIIYKIDKNNINNINWLGPMTGAEQSEVSALYIYNDEFNAHLIIIGKIIPSMKGNL